MAHYFDTSALVKLVVEEAETLELMGWNGDQNPTAVSSDLTRTELIRVVRRAAPELAGNARDVLNAINLITADTSIFEAAALLDPTALRSLDAVHLATALTLGDDLEGLLTYDRRLAEAARAYAVPVLSPGATDT